MAQNASGWSGQGDASRKAPIPEPKPERPDPKPKAPEPTPGRNVITESSFTERTVITPIEPTAKDKALDAARRELAAKAQTDAPSLLRLAFHDAGTYDAVSRTGGPNGSIRLSEELKKDENKDIKSAVEFCDGIKSNCDKYGMGTISYADLYQLAGVVAVETIGGPKIDFHGGRKDSNEPAPRDRLPKANKNDGPKEVAAQLRHVYYRMGLEDREIVALSRAHTLGSARSSGDGSASGGSSNKNNMKFDNSYFRRLLQDASKDASTAAATVFLPDDRCLVIDPVFHKYVELYAKDGDAFLQDYAKAHKKMSELGFRQFPQAVLYGEKDYKDMKTSMYIATIVTIAVAFLGYMYETMKK